MQPPLNQRVLLLCTAPFLVLAFAVLAAPGIAIAQGENLVENSSFEQSSEGGFKPWQATAGGKSKWEPITLTASSDSKDGSVAIIIPSPPEGDLAIVHQPIAGDMLAHESTMRFQLWGKGYASLQLQAIISFNTPGGQRKVRLMHQGSGDWELMETQFDIPKTADLNSFNVEIIVRPGGSEPAMVDDVKFWHEEIQPQYELPENADE